MRRGRKVGMSRRKRCWAGGAQTVFPASVNDESMLSASKLSLAQGADYESLHSAQHGGAAVSLSSAAPVGDTGMLDSSLRDIARVTVLDQSMGAIQGMRDQSGGMRRKKNSMRKKKGGMRKKNSMRKKKGMSRKKQGGMRKKNSMRRRKMRGGSAYSLSNAQDFGAPGMLLSPNQQATALSGMNPEWKLAEDPGAFKPAGL